jgi:hypothetical protein
MGTGFFDQGVELDEDAIAEMLASESTPGTPTGGEPEQEAPPAPEFDAPKLGAGNFDFPELAHFDAPKSSKKKGALGPDDKAELAEFYTQDGIGAIVARGFDAFFVACGAEKMSQAEHNNMAKVVAYYCRARLPKGAGAYQPELLMLATVGMAVLPRLGPIAEKTAPMRERAWNWIKATFRRKG